MKKSIVLSITTLILAAGLSNCKSNKVSCPAYGGNEKPGGIPKASGTHSGVLPSDGHGTRTKLPR